jgi:hypothetical protein
VLGRGTKARNERFKGDGERAIHVRFRQHPDPAGRAKVDKCRYGPHNFFCL